MNPHDEREPITTGDPGTDREHEVQLQLLEALELELSRGNRDAALDLMKRLADLSEVHFAAEQILMRYHSYPGYWHHEEEHGHLMTDLGKLQAQLESEEAAALAAQAKSIRQWLIGHMRSADRSFAKFVRESPLGPR